MPRVWDIHENTMAGFFQLEGFWVRGEFDRTNLSPVGGIDDAESAAPKADVNLFRGAVVTHVVRIILEIHFADQLPGFGVMDVAQPAFIVRYEELVSVGNMSETLWRSRPLIE